MKLQNSIIAATCVVALLFQVACTNNDLTLALDGITVAADSARAGLSASGTVSASDAAQYGALVQSVEMAVAQTTTELASKDTDAVKAVVVAGYFASINYPNLSGNAGLALTTLRAAIETFLALLPAAGAIPAIASSFAAHHVTKIGKVDQKKLAQIKAHALTVHEKVGRMFIPDLKSVTVAPNK